MTPRSTTSRIFSIFSCQTINSSVLIPFFFKRYSLLLLSLFVLITKSSGQDAIPVYRAYATQQYLKSMLADNLVFQENRSAIEIHNFEFAYSGVPAFVAIPVVFHFVSDEAANISLDDVEAQMEALNRDFFAPQYLVSETEQEAWTTEGFAEKAASCNIGFCLAPQTPSGDISTGALFVPSQVSTWSVGTDIMKEETGGSPAWSPDQYLNIWVAPLDNGVAGYAQMPGGPLESDGIVLNVNFFKRKDPESILAAFPASANYGNGRTLSHLVGSYLNLYELWNDEIPCGDDYVMDTPIHNAPNFEKPGYRHVSTCGDYPVEMTMNLMDNTDDDAQFMFTHGQMMRMHATLSPDGGARAGLRELNPQCADGGLLMEEETEERASSKKELAAKSLSIRVYPNPANEHFTVLISSPCEEQINLIAFNQLGELQYSFMVESASPDKNNAVQIKTKDWPPGMYVIQAFCGKETSSAKILLER